MPTRYRPDIDGLRSLAVIAVILFHTFPSVVPGGFVGVDIFFVISGFLITNIILFGLKDRTFSVAGFYRARMRRIFPALILVLIVTFALGWHFLLPTEFLSLGKNIAASALFSANLMLLSEVSYFDVSAHFKPLLHLWSLGIEEQFYLAWPLALLLTPKRWLLTATALTIAASFALNVTIIGNYPSETFYLPFTRAWELLAGALLTRLPAPNRQAREASGAFGIAALLASFFLLDSRTPFPGWAAALPVVGAAALIVSEGSLVNRFALANRAAVNIGLISYPLYLWHWPLLVFSEIYRFKPLTDAQCGLVIVASFVLAWLTYEFLEKPIRHGIYRNRSLLPLASSLGIVASAGVITALAGGFPLRIPEIIRDATKIQTSRDGLRYGECLLSATSGVPSFPKSCIDPGNDGLVVVWGDSTAAVLANGLNQIKEETGYRLAQMTLNSCPPILADAPNLPKHCAEANRTILNQITQLKPETVLLHAAWNGSIPSDLLEQTIDALRLLKIPRIVLVGPTPQWDVALPWAISDYFNRNHTLIPERTTLYLRPDQQADRALMEMAGAIKVEYFSAKGAMCSEDGCLTRTGPEAKDITTSDFIHLTPNGSRILALELATQLRKGH
jgi:peptidoglycan/LPS O-acetylase OafA/YrhL